MYMKSLSTIVRYGNIFLNRNLSEMNITSAEHNVIVYLARNNNFNQDEIANYYTLDKGSISKTLKSLESKGYVIRTENPDNRRKKNISLTEKARRESSNMHQLMDKWDEVVLAGISSTEIEQFNKILNKITDNAKNAIKNL